MRTIIYTYLASSALVTIVMAVIWVQNRKRFKGTSHWLIFSVLQTIGLGLFVMRHHLPPFTSIVVANIVIVTGYLSFMTGIRRFIGQKSKYTSAVVIFLILSALMFIFGTVTPNFKARTILITSILIIIYIIVLYLLVYKTDKSEKSIYREVIIVCVLTMLLFATRLFIAVFVYPDDINKFEFSQVDAIMMIASQMLSLMLAFSFVLMINLRLFKDVQSYADEKELMVHELRRLATIDSLTGLFNRSKIEQVLTIEVLRARRYKHPLSVIIADIDHFKNVNDTFGHNTGDQVLAGIASIMKSNIREVDTLGRWGGEEFLIVCPETTADGARKLADTLRKKIERHSFREVGIKTISMGVAQIEGEEWDEDLIRRADKNLYRAKRGGRNRVE